MGRVSIGRRMAGALVAVSMIAAVCSPSFAGAANKTLLQAQAQSMAVANSSDISKKTKVDCIMKLDT